MGITGAKSVDILNKWTLKRSDKESVVNGKASTIVVIDTSSVGVSLI